MQTELIHTIEARNTLGEGILWDHREETIWWTDIQECRQHRYHLPTADLQTFDTPERLGAFGLTGTPGRFVAAFETGFAFFVPHTGSLEWIEKVEQHRPETRLNDGRVDRQGRFWSGAMVEDELQTQGAGLYQLAPDGTVIQRERNIMISNSICWSPDSRRFYFADSPGQTIYAYDFNAKNGEISNRQVFAATKDEAYPDGSEVDCEGRLWNAEWNGSRVTCYSPDGAIFGRVDLPVSQPTCVAFGGSDLDLLLVTSARDGLSDAELAHQPLAGSVFIYKTSARGLRAPLFIPDNGTEGDE